MNRVEKYRAIRLARKKIKLLLTTCFILVLIGIITVDYSINDLMNKENGIRLVEINQRDDNYTHIKLLNNNLYFNIEYIKEDINRVVKWILRHD
ncbi:UNVERIFIED_CONTAM: hypothetical protein Cloal_3943 [Acetivibrio alkalicellulosi]